MAITYKLPKIQGAGAAIVDTPVAGDTALATGVLTLKNEAGTEAFDVKISDMGGCMINEGEQKRKNQQTCYYMAPELILKLPYNESADMWALGCILYEIVCGKILFDPSKYDGNEDRYHLHLIESLIEPVPEHMKKLSTYKDVIFSSNMKRIKGFDELIKKDIKNDLVNYLLPKHNKDLKQITSFCDFLFQCLSKDTNDQLAASFSWQSIKAIFPDELLILPEIESNPIKTIFKDVLLCVTSIL